MVLLANVLQGDRTDLDLIQLALETLANVMTYESGNDEGKNHKNLYYSIKISSRTSEFTSGYHHSIYR
jgi:hypothetical protein